jgi:hypothetical protein
MCRQTSYRKPFGEGCLFGVLRGARFGMTLAQPYPSVRRRGVQLLGCGNSVFVSAG